METKIIKAVFGGSRYTVTAKRTRTDYGQVLEFVGVDLPSTFECIFSNSATSSGVGKKQIGSAQRVLIPDEYLTTGQTIYAWILLHDTEDDGRHMYSVRIPVADMPDTSPEEPTPVEQSVISQAITALNSAVTTTTQKAQEATESADRAEHAAEGVEGYAERAESAQQAAESARDRATQAETSARTSAATASEKASEAISSATTASQSALTAENASDSAQASADASYQNAQTAYRYAQDSATSAGQAESYAGGAGIYASDAQTHSQTASQKASEAAQSASTAVQAKTDAESAKTASQTAQTASESARDGAVSAKTGAESARDEAQSIADGITGKVEQIDSNTDRIESLEDDRYKPYAVDTASGAVASFADGADGIPLKSCIVRVEPVQAGSGDPSPDNVRPITGWTGCEVQRTGKNLLNADTYYGDYKQSDGSYLLSASNLSIILIPLKTFIGKTVTFSTEATIGETTNLRIRAFINGRATNGTPATNNATNTISLTATPVTDNDYIHITYGSGGSNPVTLRNVQLEEGSAVTTYESFGQTYPITFPASAGTVYGAYVDVLSGKLTLTYYFCTPDNAKRITYGIDAQSNLPYAYFSFVQNGSAVALAPRTLCSMYKAGGASRIDKALRMWGSEADIWDSDLDVTSLDTVKAYFADLMIVYPLATPIEIQLDAHTINSLYGQNNIWSNTGDTEVAYRADTTLYIKRLTDSDTDMIVDANIVSGQYFMVGNNLYRATANIASGASVIVGTNAMKVSLTTALNEINQ